jgi:hypothetical protein
MDIARLILEYLQVLVWPSVVVALAIMFKKPLATLLGRIRKIGFAGGSLDADADEASNEADNITSPASSRKRDDELGGPVGPPASEPQVGRPPEDEAQSLEVAPPPTSGVEVPPLTPTDLPSPAPSGPKVPVDSGERQVDEDVPNAHSNDQREISRGADISTPTSGQRQPAQESGLLFDDHKLPLAVDSKANGDDLGSGKKSLQFYENLRQLAIDAPSAATREAYQRVRSVAREALRQYAALPGSLMRADLKDFALELVEADLAEDSVMEPSMRLTRIYQTNKTSNELSPKGALSFIDAAQKLEHAFTESLRLSRKRRRTRSYSAASGLEKVARDLMPPDTYKIGIASEMVMIKLNDQVTSSTADRFMREADKIAELHRVTLRIEHRDELHRFIY